MYNTKITDQTGDTMSNLGPTHSFNVEDAIKYGSIEKAIVAKEIRGMQVHTLDSLVKKFPYMKRSSIARTLEELRTV